jgi:hypothetical protein
MACAWWRGQNGSWMASRAMAIRSAWSFCRMSSACGPSSISPTAMVIMPASRLICSAYGTWKPGPRYPVEAVAPAAALPPDEQSMTSTPRAFSLRASTAESSISQPPSKPSTEDMRTNSGLSSGHTGRTASVSSSRKRILFSRLPPYSSVRRLDKGDRNCCARYPCAACNSISSMPIRSARLAASTNRPITRAMSAWLISRGTSQPLPAGTGLGPITCHGKSPRAASVSSSAPLPCQGRWMLALRPAWPSWMPGTTPWPFMKSTAGLIASARASSQIPMQPWVIRPMSSTAVASRMIAPGRPSAYLE